MLGLVLFNFLLSGVIFISAQTTESPQPPSKHVWAWKCVDNKSCLKANISEVTEPMSYQVCHLSCGNSVLWPYPSGQVTISKTIATINPHSVSIESSSSHKTDANPNVQELMRLNGKIFSDGILALLPGQKTHGSTKSLSVTVDIESPSQISLTQETDESYSLKIESAADGRVKANVKSNNYFGARHGLETLRQLIVYDSFSKNLVIPTEVSITDSPKYSYRGILLDTARSFVSVPLIKKTIEAMSANKLNTFHWHITDSQSFPFSSKTHPEFTTYGAYSDEEVYTEEDIKSIVHHGLVHGVRVMPEFDAPGHVGEGWQWAPENTTVCFRSEPWQSYCVEPPCGQLNPTSEHVYNILEGIYSDMSDLFDSDLFHMGGDEVNLNCWNSSENVVENMAKMNLGRSHDDFHDLWSHFQKKALGLVDKTHDKPKTAILWTSSLTSDKITEYLDKSRYIIQIWTKGNDRTIADLINKGYRIIFSNYDALYFDCGFGAWVGNGNNWCSPYIPWQKVYDNDPEQILRNLGVDYEANKHLVMGGEAALWTEQADDSSIGNRLWPRGAALGERLWTGSSMTWKDAKNRIMYHRGRMVHRGFTPDTLQPEWCDQNDGKC